MFLIHYFVLVIEEILEASNVSSNCIVVWMPYESQFYHSAHHMSQKLHNCLSSQRMHIKCCLRRSASWTILPCAERCLLTLFKGLFLQMIRSFLTDFRCLDFRLEMCARNTFPKHLFRSHCVFFGPVVQDAIRLKFSFVRFCAKFVCATYPFCDESHFWMEYSWQ